MKLGIFGGSFNPIHNAHIKLCEYVIEKTVVDKILLVPTGDNPLKNTDDMILSLIHILGLRHGA